MWVFEDGYASDYGGYAVPHRSRVLRVREDAYVNGGSARPVPSRPGTLPVSTTAALRLNSPAYELSPSRRVAGGGRSAAAGSHLSDSLSSLSSVATNSSYRGLSGTIARNLDSLAARLDAVDRRFETLPAPRRSSAASFQGDFTERSELAHLQAQVPASHNWKSFDRSQNNALQIPALNSRINSLAADRGQLAAELAAAKDELFARQPARQPPPVPPKRSQSVGAVRGPAKAFSTSNLSQTDAAYSTAIARAFRQVPAQATTTATLTLDRGQSPGPYEPERFAPLPSAPPPPRPASTQPILEHRERVVPPTAKEAPILRTPNGSTINLAAFASLRRNPSQSSLNLPPDFPVDGPGQPGVLRKDSGDGYASDSEIALGMTKPNSLVILILCN